MEKSRFIFIIDAEKHYNILVRIMVAFNRQRIPIKEFNSQIREDNLRVTIGFEEAKDVAFKLSRKLNKEVDIISISLFEQMI